MAAIILQNLVLKNVGGNLLEFGVYGRADNHTAFIQSVFAKTFGNVAADFFAEILGIFDELVVAV